MLAKSVQHHLSAAASVHVVDRGVGSRERPEPVPRGPDVPTRLIGEHRGRAADIEDQAVEGRQHLRGGACTAWASPPGLRVKPARSCSTRQVFRMVSPNCLFNATAKAWARGPSWVLAAPVAVEVCKGWELCTSPQMAQWPR